MKLNKQGREELRKLVEKELAGGTVQERIKFDKDVLELLLFERIIYRRNPTKIVKIPIWSGPFLGKIDLSDISFEDVSWTLLKDGKTSKLGSTVFDEDCWEYFKKEYGTTSIRVDYINTNAPIDFNKSFEAKEDGSVSILNCNFTGTDLSSVGTGNFKYVQGSMFSNTGLVIEEKLMASKESIFHYSDLSGLDLRTFVISAIDISSSGGPLIGMGCNLSGTGISIILKTEDFKEKVHKNNFRTILASGDLNGCYINGKRVLSSEEKQALASQSKEKYEKFKGTLFDSISSSIQKQLH